MDCKRSAACRYNKIINECSTLRTECEHKDKRLYFATLDLHDKIQDLQNMNIDNKKTNEVLDNMITAFDACNISYDDIRGFVRSIKIEYNRELKLQQKRKLRAELIDMKGGREAITVYTFSNKDLVNNVLEQTFNKEISKGNSFDTVASNYSEDDAFSGENSESGKLSILSNSIYISIDSIRNMFVDSFLNEYNNNTNIETSKEILEKEFDIQMLEFKNIVDSKISILSIKSDKYTEAYPIGVVMYKTIENGNIYIAQIAISSDWQSLGLGEILLKNIDRRSSSKVCGLVRTENKRAINFYISKIGAKNWEVHEWPEDLKKRYKSSEYKGLQLNIVNPY